MTPAASVNVAAGTTALHENGLKEAGLKPHYETGCKKVTETALGNEITTQKTSSSSQTNKIFEESKMTGNKNHLEDQGNIFKEVDQDKKGHNYHHFHEIIDFFSREIIKILLLLFFRIRRSNRTCQSKYYFRRRCRRI